MTPAPSASPPRPLLPPPGPSGPRDYTIVEGDTFTSIAEEYLGDARKWVLIARENPDIEPTRLAVGQKIRLPAQDATLPPPASVAGASGSTAGGGSPGAVGGSRTETPAPGATRHQVRQGETLASIAERYYGTKAESAWRRIYEANRATIGDDPARLRVGASLVIPPRS